MRKVTLFLTIILITIKSFGCNNNSIFSIYLQQDSIPNTISVVFENKSNDTILLFTNFENFFTEFKYRPGFRILFFNNDRLFVPNWGELPQYNYRIAEGRINVPPFEKVVLTINLPFLSAKKADDEDRLFVILELNYRHSVKNGKNIEMKYFKSEYFELTDVNKTYNIIRK